MLEWLVIGVGDITTKRVLPAILAEKRSKLVGIVTRDPRKAEPYGVPGWSDLSRALTTARIETKKAEEKPPNGYMRRAYFQGEWAAIDFIMSKFGSINDLLENDERSQGS